MWGWIVIGILVFMVYWWYWEVLCEFGLWFMW